MNLLKVVGDRVLTELKKGKSDVQRAHGAADLSAAIERGQSTKDLYIVRLQVTSGKNTLINRIQQREEIVVGVLSWVRNVSDALGGAGVVDQDAQSALIKQALLGWKPANEYEAFTSAGGELLTFAAPAFLWADKFMTAHHLRGDMQ